jgi:hypothetical protein
MHFEAVKSYTKPQSICMPAEHDIDVQQGRPGCAGLMDDIKRRVSAKGLLLRSAQIQDIMPVWHFIRNRFPPALSEEISPYDLFRFIEFGNGIILENQQSSEILGSVFEVGYDTPERTSYTLRLAVDNRLKGRNLGADLLEYSCLQALQRGSGTKRALIDADNFPSLNIFLNKLGFICDGFYYQIEPLGTCFSAVLPLNAQALYSNRIDLSALYTHLDGLIEGKDYLLLDNSHIELINNIYQHTEFRVVALIPPGGWKENSIPLSLALPLHSINAIMVKTALHHSRTA